MSRKALVMIGMTVGSYAGSYIPLLWGAGSFSMSSIFFGALGGIAGIYLGFRLTE